MDFKAFKLDSSTYVGSEKKEEKAQKAWQFRRGRYNDVTIESIEERGPSKSDPTWQNVCFTLNDDKREIRYFVLVPTMRFTFGEKATMAVWQKTERFLNTLGFAVDNQNAPAMLPMIFGPNLQKLVGFRLDIEIGYRGYYSEKENGKIYLYDEKNSPVCEKGTKTPITFPDFGAAENYAVEKLGQEIAWPEVTKVHPATTPNAAAKIAEFTEKKKVKVDF